MFTVTVQGHFSEKIKLPRPREKTAIVIESIGGSAGRMFIDIDDLGYEIGFLKDGIVE